MAADRSHNQNKQRDTGRQPAVDKTEASHDAEQPMHPLLRLQQQVGNQQVARMLAQRQAEEAIMTQRVPAVQLERDTPEVGLAGGPISDGLAKRIQSKRGSGSPLPDSTRSRMESGFGTSFEHVRLHTDTESASISRSLGAKAATTGSDIFFGQGASPSDTSLVAHELTHVVQQSTMRGGGPMTVNKEGDSHEQEANAMSRAITSKG